MVAMAEISTATAIGSTSTPAAYRHARRWRRKHRFTSAKPTDVIATALKTLPSLNAGYGRGVSRNRRK